MQQGGTTEKPPTVINEGAVKIKITIADCLHYQEETNWTEDGPRAWRLSYLLVKTLSYRSSDCIATSLRMTWNRNHDPSPMEHYCRQRRRRLLTSFVTAFLLLATLLASASGAPTQDRVLSDDHAPSEGHAHIDGHSPLESSRAASTQDRALRALSERMYDKCTQHDALACLGLKAFYAAARFVETPQALANVNSDRARQREAEADRVLASSAASLLSASLRKSRRVQTDAHADVHADGDGDSNPASQPQLGSESTTEFDTDSLIDLLGERVDEDGPATDRRRSGLHFAKKMLFPLLIGVVLKLASLIPLILGKLTFLGTVSLMSSKLSLAILLLMSLKKWLGGSESSGHSHSDGSYYAQHHQTSPAAHAYAPAYDAHPYEAHAHALAASPADFAAHGAVHSPVHGAVHAAVHPGALAHAPYRRVYRTYHVVRGRQLGGDEMWGSGTEPTTSTDEHVAEVQMDEDKAKDEVVTATNGFSVSREDVTSDVRRLDEVEGQLGAN